MVESQVGQRLLSCLLLVCIAVVVPVHIAFEHEAHGHAESAVSTGGSDHDQGDHHGSDDPEGHDDADHQLVIDRRPRVESPRLEAMVSGWLCPVVLIDQPSSVAPHEPRGRVRDPPDRHARQLPRAPPIDLV